MLADFGAEVIKVEKPGVGDPARATGPFRDDKPDPEGGGLFLYLNTSKKSITLDLESAAGVKIIKELVAQTDILVENFGAGVMQSLGLDYETLKGVNPRLVMTSISSFGQTGPYSDYQATDLTIWGLSGILYELGEADREPLKMGANVSEYVAGLYGCLVTHAALYYRDETGVGQHVDLSSWEAFHTMQPSMTLFSYAGFIRKRAGVHFPWGILPCEDGYIGFYLPTQTHWELLCTLLEMPELREKPEYETPMMREERRDEITAIIVSWLRGRRMDEVFHAAQELRLPLTIVPNMKQVLELEQHKTRGYFADIDHPVAGRLTYPGAPFKLAETPWQAGRAPLLGEHNEEVYCERLSYGKDDLARLAEKAAI
jgi:crotonobetainyl-CoA:carnitine CoA-transferase CaiB-like acyl-CoA transferase